MKFINVFLISVAFFACTVKKNASFLPPEYQFPDIKTNERKTYVYIDRSNGDSSFYDYYRCTRNGQIYFINKAYTTKEVSDSSVYLNGKLFESYSYMFSKDIPTKAVILRDTVVNNGKRFGKNILQENFNSDSITDSFRAEFEFVKDTIINWQNTTLPTLVIEANLYFTIKSKIISSIHTDYQTSFLVYQAKGIGTVRFKFFKTADNKIKNIDLVQIRNSTSE